MITITPNTAVDDIKRLRAEKERRDLEAIRAVARLASFRDDVERFDQVGLLCETQLHALEEAYLHYDDDEPNVERSIENAHQLERMERCYDGLMRQWENQLKRIEWERKQTNALR
jgi:hypothetical protein